MNIKKIIINGLLIMIPLMANAETQNAETQVTPKIPSLNDLINNIGKKEPFYFNIPLKTQAGESLSNWEDAENMKEKQGAIEYYHVPINKYSYLQISDKDIQITTYVNDAKIYRAELKVTGFKNEAEYKELEEKIISKIMSNGFDDFTYDDKLKNNLLDKNVKEYTDGISFIKDNVILTLKANNKESKKYGWEQWITEFTLVVIDVDIVNIQKEVDKNYEEYKKNQMESLINRIF